MLYNSVMKISLKCNLKPAVQIFNFLPPSYNTLLSYGAKSLCNVCFHGRILCMNTDIYMAYDLCVSIFGVFFPPKLYDVYVNSLYFNSFLRPDKYV